MRWPHVSESPEQQAFYEQCRAEGTSHSLSEVFALQQFPQPLGTDSGFFAGHWEDQSKTRSLNHHRLMAEKAGVSTQGKRYMSQLARFPADPRAWVSGLGDIKRIADEDNLGLSGSLSRTRVTGIDDPGPDKPYEVAADVIEDHAETMIAHDPSLAKDVKAVRQHLRKTLKGNLK